MDNIIKPRDFLLQHKSNRATVEVVKTSDLIEISELGITLPLALALEESGFHSILKKAVSDFNSDAALNGALPVDFDDLYTKYSEYMAVLKLFVQESK